MIKKWFSMLLFFFIVILTIGSMDLNGRNEMKITSNAFQNECMIPDKYTCKGQDISPSLKWEGAPPGTKSFVIICDDPDAPVGTWDHWLLFNIPASVTELNENIPDLPELANGIRQGKNSWGRTDYGGPCPPSGTHRYFFKLFALDAMLDLKPGADKKQIMRAMEGHILGKAELMGKFKK